MKLDKKKNNILVLIRFQNYQEEDRFPGII